MAAALPSDPSLTANNVAKAAPSTDFTGFLQYKPPFDEPTLELKYEISYSLSEIIDTFKSMVFDDYQKLPKALRDSMRFSKRHCTYSEKSQTNIKEFKGNEKKNLCEVLKFDVTLLPLLPGFDPKEYEKKMRQKQEEESKQSESEKEAKSGWGSWASISSWKDWGSSMLDTEAWSNSINAWMEYFNMSMDANEIWKIDWIQHKATSFVKNITMSWTVAVYEYAEMEQIMHVSSSDNNDDSKEKKTDDEVKVIFIKKLYVYPIITMPQYALNLLKDQYKKDSDTQIQLVKTLCDKPLTETDKNGPLQQMDDV